MKIALTASVCVTSGACTPNPLILIEDGIIVKLGRRSELEIPGGFELREFPDAVIAPGFVDIHIHGGAGHDVMEADEAALGLIERHLAKTGVTTYLPTTVTAPLDTTLRALERLATAVESAAQSTEGTLRARPAGIHLEGPFISHQKRGVHPPEHIQPPSIELFDRMWQAARGQIKLMTVAPEVPGAIELVEEAVRRGVCVSIGHSNAESETALRAIRAGARHATHTFNAMRAFDHREPGIIGAVLSSAHTYAEIIADGIHVAPAALSMFLRCKGVDRAVLVTDAMSATGMPDGTYQLGSFAVEVKDGVALSEGKLAGSVLTLDAAVRNVMAFTGWELHDALPLVTRNPAAVVGLNCGKLEPGSPADLVVLSPTGNVLRTVSRGAGLN